MSDALAELKELNDAILGLPAEVLDAVAQLYQETKQVLAKRPPMVAQLVVVVVRIALETALEVDNGN